MFLYNSPTMDLNNLRKGGDQHPEKGKDKGPGAPPFLSNILTTFLIFLFLVAAYSFVSGRQPKTEDISLSQLARDVESSLVKSIGVESSDLTVEYTDGTKKKSKKEVEASLSDTLKNYGVTPEELGAVQVDIKGPSGFGYWALSLAPILLPILFLLVLVWFLTRQVRSSGVLLRAVEGTGDLS